MPTMRRIAILAALLLACDAEDPPPGDVIGTFDFVATLEPAGECLLEDVPGIPASFRFSAILSHDPATGKLWLRAGSTEQTGTIDGARFTVKTPAQGGGIPRTFDACTVARRQPCAFEVVETIEAEILSDCPSDFVALAEDLPCPEMLDDGSLVWHNCACIRGTLEELLRFEPKGDEVCTCAGRTQTDAFAGACRLLYRLEGEKR